MAMDDYLQFGTKLDDSGVMQGMEDMAQKVDGYTIGKNVFANLATNAAEKLQEVFTSVVAVGTGFEAAMANVQAVSGATDEELAQLTRTAREYGAETRFSATQCAEGMKYMGQAGWQAQQMIDGLPGILDLSAASGEDLALVSDIVTDALTAFGLQAADAAHFADVLAVASSSSNTNVAMLGETFQYAAPVAGALGYSVEDVALAAGLMANAGIKASQAGTTLRAVLSSLTKPTKEQQEAMDTLGISLQDSEGNMLPLVELLEQLRGKFSGMDAATAASTASTLAGTEAMSGFLAIMNASDSDFSGLQAAIEGCDGAAAQMAGTMNGTVEGSMKTLQSAGEELMLSLYDAFRPVLEAAIPALQQGIEWITDHLEDIGRVAKPTAVAIGGIFAVNGVIKFTASIKSLFDTIRVGMATNPAGQILLIAETLAAVGAAVYGLYDAMQGVPDYDGTLRACRTELENTSAALETAKALYGEDAQAVQELQEKERLLQRQYQQGGGIAAELSQELETASEAYHALAEEQEAAIQGINDLESNGLQAVAMLESLSQKSQITDADLELMGKYAAYLNDTFQCSIEVDYDTRQLTGFDPQSVANQLAEQAKNNRKNAAFFALTDTEVVGNYLQAFDSLKQAEAEATEKYQEYQTAVNSGAWGETTIPLYNDYQALVPVLDQAKAAIAEQNDYLYQQGEIAGMTREEVDSYIQSLLTSQSAVDQMQNASTEHTLTAQDGMEQAQAVAASYKDQILELCGAYDAAYQSAYDSFSGQFGLMEQAQADAAATVDKAQDAMDSQLAYWDAYNSNLDVLRQNTADTLGVTQEQYDALMQYVQTGTAEAAGLAQSLADSIQGGNADAVAELAKTIGAVQEKQQEAAASIAEMKTGLHTELQGIYQQMQEDVAALKLTDEAQAAADETIQAYITETEKAVRTANLSGAQAAAEAAWEDLGGYMVSGLTNGIYAQQASLQAAGAWAAAEVNAAFRAEADINSPSRVMEENGGYMALGSIRGMEAHLQELRSVGASAAQAMVGGFTAVQVSAAPQLLSGSGTVQSIAAAPAAGTSGGQPPCISVYCQIGDDDIDAHILRTIYQENAATGGYSI